MAEEHARTGPPPAEALADLVGLLEGCPAFTGVTQSELEQLSAGAELAYVAEGATLGPEGALGPLVVWRGALLIHDATGRTIDLLAEGEFHAPAADERLEVVEAALVVALPERAIDLAWSAAPEQLRGARQGWSSHTRVDLQTAPVRAVMSAPLLTADRDEPVRAAAGRMREHGVSSLVTIRGEERGILTDRDLRNRLVASGASPDTPVGDVATFPVRTIAADVPTTEALVEMLAAGIHHMPVEEGGRLVGMVTSSDLLQLGTRSPLFLRKALDRAGGVADVVAGVARLPDTVRALLDAGTSPADTSRIIATVTDRVATRLLDLSAAELGPPPSPFGWVAFGSQGRREQTLHSDQDTGLLMPDGLDAESDAWFGRLGKWMTLALQRCGYPRCGGGVMASEPAWRGEVGWWCARYLAFVRTPTTSHVLGSQIGFDLRTVAGDLDAQALLGPTIATAAREQRFLAHLAKEATRLRPPLGFRGRFAVDRSGEQAGTLDLKAGAMLPITDIARLHTLARGGGELGTAERLTGAAAARRLSEDLAATLRSGYEVALGIRLRRHLEQHRAGLPFDNRIDPGSLPPLVRSDLKVTFRAIRVAQDDLAATYLTSLLA